MAGLTVKETQSRQWNAWTGTREELEKIAAIAEQCYKRREQQLAGESKEQDADEGFPSLRTDLIRLLKFEAIASSGDQSISGSTDEVLKALELRTIETLELKASFSLISRDDSISVTFDWRGPDPAIDVSITSTDPGWLAESIGLLSAEIDKGKPWWSRAWHPNLRGVGVSVAVAMVTWAVAVAAWNIWDLPSLGWDKDAPRPPRATGAIATLIVSLVGGILSAVGLAAPSTFKRLLPRIDVHQEGSRPAGTAFILALGGVALSLLVGIYIEIVL